MARSATPKRSLPVELLSKFDRITPKHGTTSVAAYNKLGRYKEATAACEQALRYKPDFELARNNLQYARTMTKARAK